MDKLAKIETKEVLLKQYNVSNCIRLYRKVETALVASKENAPSLSILKKEHGEEFSLSFIHAWLISLNEFVNVARKLTPGQIEEIALYIFDDYYYLNMADLYLITTRIKKGHYGNLYENLDGMKILAFFKDYANERANSNESEFIRESDKQKYLDEKSNIPRSTKND